MICVLKHANQNKNFMLRKRALIHAGDLKYGKEASVAEVQQRFFLKDSLETTHTLFILRESSQVTFRGFVERVRRKL